MTTYDRGMLQFMNRSASNIAVETVTLVLLALVAIGGNALVLLSFYRNPSLRTVTNYFVLSLSITDIVIASTVLPPTLIWSIKSRFVFGQGLCDFQAIWSSGLTLVSVTNIAVMAVNRFVCVCKPHIYKKLFNHKTSVVMIIGFWVSSFTIMILARNVGGGVYSRFSPFKITCLFVYTTDGNKAGAMLRYLPHMLFLGLPFSIMALCYYRVFKAIRRHKNNIAPSSNGSLGTSVQEIKITWTLFAVLLAYCLTWIPVFSVLLAANVTEYVPREAQMIVTYTGIGSSAINPVIYGFFNTAIRKEYKKIFGR